MVPFAWSMVPIPWKVELNSVWTTDGEQFAMISGEHQMPEWCVDSLETLIRVSSVSFIVALHPFRSLIGVNQATKSCM